MNSLPNAFDALVEKLDSALREAPDSVIGLALVVNANGHYEIVMSGFSATRPQVYQTIGLLDQIKLDLLASIPRNRPLREPEGPVEDDDDEIDEPIGQA